METKTMTLELPASLYADLESLAAEEQQNLVEVLAHLVKAAGRRRAWLSDVRALREQIRLDGGLDVGRTKEQVVEQLRQTRREIFETQYAHLYR